MRLSRRAFLREAAAAAAATCCGPVAFAAPKSSLARIFPDLKRHLIFEYYAWYGMSPPTLTPPTVTPKAIGAGRDGGGGDGIGGSVGGGSMVVVGGGSVV